MPTQTETLYGFHVGVYSDLYSDWYTLRMQFGLNEQHCCVSQNRAPRRSVAGKLFFLIL